MPRQPVAPAFRRLAGIPLLYVGAGMQIVAAGHGAGPMIIFLTLLFDMDELASRIDKPEAAWVIAFVALQLMALCAVFFPRPRMLYGAVALACTATLWTAPLLISEATVFTATAGVPIAVSGLLILAGCAIRTREERLARRLGIRGSDPNGPRLLCARCGYALVESSGPCPECGECDPVAVTPETGLALPDGWQFWLAPTAAILATLSLFLRHRPFYSAVHFSVVGVAAIALCVTSLVTWRRLLRRPWLAGVSAIALVMSIAALCWR